MKYLSLKSLLLVAAIAGVLTGTTTRLQAVTESPAMEQDQPAAANENLTVQQQIQAKLASDANFNESELALGVTSDAVFLTGRVRDEQAHDRALNIVETYAGNRRIMDHTRIERLYPWTR
jgi:osmotically-inducible protein OsmY